jgi:hypothetical protein
MNLDLLKTPFAPSDVSWRIGQAGKKQNGDIWAKVLAYLDNRCIQDRLDEVVGPANWRNEYAKGPEGGVLCGLSIKIDGEWVTKWDGAENTDIESIKGGLSDSMKRAAVQWGIGRYLYELGESWAEIVNGNTPGARYANCKVKVQGKEDWATFHWLPPRGVLPESKQEPPKVEPPKQNGKAKEVAATTPGLTTADKLPPKSPAYSKAIEKIEAAVKASNPDEIARILNVADQAHTDNKLSNVEYTGLANECTLALKKINAADKEPVAA